MRMTGNQVRYLIALVLMLALVTLSGYYDGPAAVAAVGTLVLLFPLGAWLILFRARPAEQTLRVYDMLRRRWDWGYYFEATVVTAPSIEPKFLVERRFIELLLPVMGLSAYFAEKITTVRYASGIALATFLGFAILILAVSAFLLIAIWVYEDSGFREHGRTSTTVGVPLRRVKGILVYGGLAAYLSFSSTLAGSLAGALGLTIAILLFFGPVCYLLATLFDARMKNKAVEAVRKRATAIGFPLKSMSVS